VVLGVAVREVFGVGAEVEGADGASDVPVGALGFAGAGVVAAGVLAVAGAGVVVGVPGGGAKTAAPALPGRRRASRRRASSTSRDRAALGADAWVIAGRCIVLLCSASIAPGGSAGKRRISQDRMGWRTP
jgi:hypothetical protein